MPTNLVKLHGNRSGKGMPKGEPQFKAKMLRPPAGLSPAARGLWVRLSKPMSAAGVLTEADWLAFLQLCVAYGDWVFFRGQIEGKRSRKKSERSEGEGWLKDVGKFVMVHPLAGLENRMAKRVLSYLQEFGMTPASRTRIRVDVGSVVDEFEATRLADPRKRRA